MTKMSDVARFWLKVEKTDSCWEFKGAKDRKGYGRFSVGGSHKSDGTRRNSMMAAHRFAYEQAFGGIDSGLWVLHRCDNPACVRPEHLFLGDALDNVHDMDAKGRRKTVARRGAMHPNAVLTEDVVRAVVLRHRLDGVSQRQIAKELGLSVATVNHIFCGRLWGHLQLEGTSAFKGGAA